MFRKSVLIAVITIVMGTLSTSSFAQGCIRILGVKSNCPTIMHSPTGTARVIGTTDRILERSQSIFTDAIIPTLATENAEELKDVIVGSWDWACCSNNVYSGQIEISSIKNGEIVGKFGGAGGGSIVGHIDGQRIHFRRETDACSSDGRYQDWVGTYNPNNRTIAGTLSGCNVNDDENIKKYPRFTMTRSVPK